MTTFIITPGSTAERFRLGYGNIMRASGVEVTATTSETGFPVQNAFDGLTTDFWKHTSTSGTILIENTAGMNVDYFAFYGSNLSETAGTIKLQSWDGTDWVDETDALTASDAGARVVWFSSAKQSTQWRVVVSSDPAAYFADISLGSAIKFEHGVYIGFSEPLLARDDEIITSRAQLGAFQGRSIRRRGFATDVSIGHMRDSFARTTFQTFLDAASEYPFYMGWDVLNYPLDSSFCWFPSGMLPKASHSAYGWCQASFQVVGPRP